MGWGERAKLRKEQKLTGKFWGGKEKESELGCKKFQLGAWMQKKIPAGGLAAKKLGLKVRMQKFPMRVLDEKNSGWRFGSKKPIKWQD